MHVFDRDLAVLSIDEVLHHARAERSGAIQRDNRDQIGKTLRSEIAHEFRDARRFELKYRTGFAFGEHSRGYAVLERD